MYAMLVGKLPFRSPRQGTKRRQKLLEQISAGLIESHEKEMEHISTGARDLIFRLLQPDPHRRTGLDEVMLHPWITKEGTQPLVPFKYVPPDAGTQMKVRGWVRSRREGGAGSAWCTDVSSGVHVVRQETRNNSLVMWTELIQQLRLAS